MTNSSLELHPLYESFPKGNAFPKSTPEDLDNGVFPNMIQSEEQQELALRDKLLDESSRSLEAMRFLMEEEWFGFREVIPAIQSQPGIRISSLSIEIRKPINELLPYIQAFAREELIEVDDQKLSLTSKGDKMMANLLQK